MVTNDKTTNDITQRVFYEVSKLAWNGELEEKKELLPEEMIPGPHPQYRCCIYREREIIRERVRMARGLCPGKKDTKNIVQVIPAACDDCPLAAYSVTDNCHGCLGHACYNSCHFGAISFNREGNRVRAHIDPNKCKECGMCARACPYGAIVDLVRPCKKACPVGAITMDPESGLCQIGENKCIQCGHCIHACPFGAIGAKTFIIDVINMIRSGAKVYAMIAPAVEGQYGKDITVDSWRAALKKAGFADLIEVSLGGDLTAAAEADEWTEAWKNGGGKTTSCCPAFVAMIRKHFPELKDIISTTVSPMCGVSRMLKEREPDCVTVFIGPCQAKKAEILDTEVSGNADYALTFDEAYQMLRGKGIDLEPVEEFTQQGSTYGKHFGNSGGVAAAVIQCMKEQGVDTTDLKVKVCNGAAECKTALTLMKMGRLPEKFVEGMICQGGCVQGPSRQKTLQELTKDREEMIGRADSREVHENLKMQDADKVRMHRSEEV
jgi:[FeFe] hydrogenase (group B1/B3)